MEFFFYASYAMSALIVLLETISIRLEKQSETQRSRRRKQALHAQRERLSLAGRIVYPTILLAVIGAGALVYTGAIDLGARPEPTGRPLTDVVREQAAALAGLVPFIAPADVAEAAGEEDPAITLRLRSWRPEDTRPMQVILDAFAAHARQELGRQITVLYEPVVGISYDSILDAQLEKGNGPDLFYVHPYSVEGRISQHLLPLNDLPIQDGFDENRRAAWESDTFSGGESKTIYAMPYVGVVQAVYYNQGIFDRLDLDVPRTWEEFLLISQALRDAGVLPIANGLNSTEDSEMFMSLLPNFVGGESGRERFMTDEGPNLCFDNYRVIRAFRAIEELRPFLPPNAATIQSSTSKELFVKQQAAMLFGGSWDLGYFQDNLVFEWSIFPVPAPEGSNTYVIFQPDVGIGINRSTAHREEAQLFLNWMMSRAAVNLTAENLPGFYPLGKIRITGSSNRYDYQFQRLANRYPTDIRWAYTEISNKSPSGIDLFRVNLNRLVKGEITAAAAARNVQAGLGEWYAPAQTCR
jgi:raffinose/stachyose/melibiose transport system substrate-binding protein